MASILNQKVTNPDGTISYVSGATPQDVSTVISAQNLQPTKQLDVTQPTETPVYPVAGLGTTNTTASATPELKATTQENQQSDLAKQIADLNTQDAGKSAFQADQYKALGFGMTYDAQGNIIPDAGTADLEAKLTSLTNEAKAIPQQLQLDATGRGITAGGLQPIQTAALRNNAIQALGVSSLIAAKNGQLTTAQHYVDNAVIQKFGPIEAKIAALTKNLELIKNDPATSLADKNRAQAQLDIQNKKAADVAQQKADYKAVQDEALKYAQVADAATLSEMQKATSPIEVAQIAATKGLKTLDQQKAESDLATAKANLAKIHSEIAVANATESTVSSDTLQGMLAVYKSTGVLPAFGNSSKSPLRAQFYAALGHDTGLVTEAGTNKAVRAGLTTALKTQQNQYSANQTAINTLDKQLALAKSYSDKVNRTGSPLINKYLLAAKSGVFGDPDTAALHNIVTTASYELAKVLSGAAASIAGTTVSSAEDAQTLLNSAMSTGQFNEVLSLMKKEADFRLNSQKDTLTQLQKDLSNVGSLSNSLDNASSTDPLTTTFDNLFKQYGG